MTSGKWRSFYGTRGGQDGAALFDVRCACCGEFVARHDLAELPSKCPRCGEGAMTNYEKLFGTPERAARTWIDYFGGFIRCADCPCCHDEHGDTCELPPKVCAWVDEEHGYDALLEWLRGDA